MSWKLLKIYLKNMYAPGAFFEGFKKGPKAIIKNILLILVAIYISVVFIAMFLSMAFGMYNTLEAVEKVQNMPSIAILISAFAILFFGFTSIATNYYTGAGDDQFFAMPLSMKDIFRAKFFMSFITDALFSGLIFSILSLVYGLKLGLLVNPLFYIGLISVFLAFSSLILSVIYILLIGLLLLFPFLRKKSVLTGIASVLIILFAASYGFLTGFSSATMDFSSTSAMTMPLALRLSSVAEKIPFIRFLASALNGKLLPIVILLALSALVIFGLLPLFASLYAKTLAGFADVKSKRLSKEKAEAVIKESKINTAFKSLLIRDVRTVFREPSFFANGPLMVFLFPLILIVSTTVPVIVEGPEGGLGALVSAARSAYLQTSPEKLNNIFYYASLIISGIMYFSGTSSNVACTAFSREGKSLSNLKAMPVTFETILKVKFWHSMLYIFVDCPYLKTILLFFLIHLQKNTLVLLNFHLSMLLGAN